jgi:hypothetical protein
LPRWHHLHTFAHKRRHWWENIWRKVVEMKPSEQNSFKIVSNVIKLCRERNKSRSIKLGLNEFWNDDRRMALQGCSVLYMSAMAWQKPGAPTSTQIIHGYTCSQFSNWFGRQKKRKWINTFMSCEI